MLLVLTTLPSAEEAESMAEKIVEAKLAACVQVLPQMTSFYSWEGEIQRDHEHLVLVKSLKAKYQILEGFIRRNHSYDVPEIIALETEQVSEGYLKWVEDYVE